MPTRRQFLGAVVPATALASSPALAHSTRAFAAAHRHLLADPRPAAVIARDEDYWSRIAQAFTVDRSLINLNNGGVSPAPAMVQNAMKRHLDFAQEAPSYHMWRIQEPRREHVRAQLASLLGSDPEEIAITRNASEGLETCLLGFDLARGDVVLTTDQDYPRMLTTLDQRVRREGIRVVKLKLPTPCDDLAQITRLFTDGIERYRPKLILMCHITNLSGQVLPVRDVVAAARRRDIPVVVDGAHAFAHFAFSIDDLGCDYYATSLHKWLFAPHGTGMLFVRKDKIPGLWPMMASTAVQASDIRKFEEIGTHPAANFLAVAEAVEFHQAIGIERKQERLRYLRDYWIDRLLQRDPGRFTLLTSRAPGASWGIASVSVKGEAPAKVSARLLREHGIITTSVDNDMLSGVRVTPSVYTTLPELDRFCAAI